MYKKPTSGKKTNLSQFGLIDIPDLDDGDEPMDLSDEDVDLEAELAALSGGKRQRPRKPAPVSSNDLDAMIAASLKDVPSDEDVSGDEDDPDLLAELQGLSIDEEPQERPRTNRPAPPPPGAESSAVSLLQERISNYTIAEKNAKESGESGRARRFGRALKTLNDLLKQARAGQPINDEDIPPPVSTGKPANIPSRDPPGDSLPEFSAPTPDSLPAPLTPSRAPAPPPRSTSITPSAPEESRSPTPPEPKDPPPQLPEMDSSKAPGLQLILNRKEEFKAAALSSKHAGDKMLALEYLKVVKQFDLVIEAYKSGQDMDLTELPTPESIAAMVRSQREEEQKQNSTEPVPEVPPEPVGLITASTVDEALKQRLAHFQEQESKAKEQGNTSKARRMGRIVKQYQDAVRQHAAGKPINTEELPTPNGFAPIPGEGSHPSPSRPAPSPAPRAASPSPSSSSVASPSPRPVPRPASRYDKQIALLLLKQKQFKEAAIKAKKEGNLEQAKEYLRAAKGFDSVLEAARGGLAVDLASLPPAPAAQKRLEDTFDMISPDECVVDTDIPCDGDVASDGSDVSDVSSRLRGQLATQLKLCLKHKEHFRAMGHVAESNRYHNLAMAVKQDMDVVAVAESLGQNPPRFHYENRKFSILQCNTDLNENDLELTIVRGIAYNVTNPKDVDTYVKFEFPYPQDAPVSDRTSLVKDTNTPQYDAVFPLSIQRNARACLRVFKRHGIKFEVYSRGGWFSRDTLLGVVQVKLAALENTTTLHEAFPLMEGRRPAGGSLEVKLRVRTPLLQQQVEHSTVKWLVIDS